MTDLIRREDALDAIYDVVTTVSVCLTVEESKIRTDTRKRCEDAVASVPAVDAVEVRRGTWKIIGRDDIYAYCSACHFGKTKAQLTDCDGVIVAPNYCSVCGAKLDGGERRCG